MPTPLLMLSRGLWDGGSERQLTELARALNPALWQPHVGCFHDDGPRADELRSAGIPVVKFPVLSFKNFTALSGARAMGKYMRAHGIQMIHAFDVPASIFGVLAGRFYGCPVVLSSTRAYRELATSQERRLLRLTDRLVDGIVVNCGALKKHLVEDEGVAADRIDLCYNGVDAARFEGHRAAFADQSVEDLLVGCICVLRPEKGLPTLLDAFARVGTQRPRTRLVLVGSGPMRDSLESQAARLGISEFVTFVPSTTEIAPWLHKIDIFVLPSLSEALSNSIMEAMLCGCAVIASHIGGTPELVGEVPGWPLPTGLTFPVGDAEVLAKQIIKLIDNPALRREYAGSGTKLIQQKFSMQAAAEQMESIYRKTLARKGIPILR